MTHDLLNDLDIGFVLTEPCTEGVAEVMSGEMRQYQRLTLLFLCVLRLLSIVVPADSLNGSINAVRAEATPDTAPKYKPAVSVNLCLTVINTSPEMPAWYAIIYYA